MGGAGQDSRVGSQSDLHKSVHQFDIDCFAQQNHPTSSIRYDSESDKQFIWAKFPSGLIFPYWVRWFFGAGAEVQLVLLVVGGERRLLSLCPAGVVVTVAPVDIARLIYFCLL